ncbi:hypothetical protein CAG53_03815 [Vibrio sp. V26_P1S5P106]|uniref:fimbrial protein n=1 Tax=unclassified Vibrio TaxID=2614977 RepID=UPI0013728D22|nr:MULTISPECIES: type 1 fimbrial protein [unclassified Vibrio]NAW70376.1 hypothetical protein [Vibrio sp. V28_P6S34P95]NAX04645.1 hypothetical protein [Vibrio sp. V30_P3S12P165]NAX39785.1 hypothetical protein [Vibrio sp. V26_P1S5P106]
MRIVMLSCLLLFCLSSGVFARHNTLRIMGSTSNQTCTIEVNGSTRNPIVLLEAVMVNRLFKPDSYFGEKWFDLALRECLPQQIEEVYLTQLAGDTTEAGNLKNTGGDAQNVELQVINHKRERIDLSTPPLLEVVLPAGQTEGRLTLGIRYFSERGDATAGSVLSSIQYLVSYN